MLNQLLRIIFIIQLVCLTQNHCFAFRDHFAMTLEALSREAKVTILIEGAPVYDDENKCLDIMQAQGTAIDKIYSVAKSFDYSVEVKNNIFVFNKLYSSAFDIPCVTHEEVVLFSDNCLKIANSIMDGEVKFDSVQLVSKFYDSLSSKQWSAAQTEGIYLSDLPDESQRHLQMYFNHLYVGGLRYPSSVVRSVIDDGENRSAVIRNTSAENSDIALEFPVAGKPVQFASLSQGFFKTSIPQKSQLPKNISAWSCQSLSEMVAVINKKSSGLKIVVDSVLGEKPVSVYGLEHSDPRSVAYAVGKMYNLYVYVRPDSIAIKPQPVRLPRKIDEVREAIRGIFPAPLLRAGRHHIGVPSYTVLQKLREFLLNSGKQKLAFSSLSSKERASIALFLAGDLWQEAKDIMKSQPTLNSAVKSGAPILLRCSADSKGFTFSALINRGGKWRRIAGMQTSATYKRPDD
jgi:hypothetical protein